MEVINILPDKIRYITDPQIFFLNSNVSSGTASVTLFTSNTKVHVYLMGLYNTATCQFQIAYGTALLIDVLVFLFPLSFQHSSE
jgi:hypothetical protein